MRRRSLSTALLTIALMLGGVAASGQINYVSRYSSCEGADTVLVGRRAFYSLISVTGYDRDTRQLMKNLNVGKVVYLNMLECPQEDCGHLDADIKAAVSAGLYTALDSTSLDEGRVSMLFFVENDHVKQMLLYTPPPRTSLIQIGCYAKLSALSTKKLIGGGEEAKKEDD